MTCPYHRADSVSLKMKDRPSSYVMNNDLTTCILHVKEV